MEGGKGDPTGEGSDDQEDAHDDYAGQKDAHEPPLLPLRAPRPQVVQSLITVSASPVAAAGVEAGIVAACARSRGSLVVACGVRRSGW